MIFPFESLVAEHREIGLVVATMIGFGFGFTLERAGFGRANKLAAQFYLYDMTVFKVMFSAIVTAMLGVVIASGFGLVDLRVISESSVSYTYLGPMIFGGFLLGVGFIISGYCPGTSMVATASGNIDGLITFTGVIIGSAVYSEIQPLVATYHNANEMGWLFLYDLVGLSPQVVALLVVVMAVGCFIGAEKVEKIFTARLFGEQKAAEIPPSTVPRRFAFAGFASLALIGLASIPIVAAPEAADASTKSVETIGAAELAQRIFDEPWGLRIIDIREMAKCSEKRAPGAECVPADQLPNIGLPFAPGIKDLVIIGDKNLVEAPESARHYKGAVYLLENGWEGWQKFALSPPEPPEAGAASAELEAYKFCAAVHSAMTGVKAAPAPAAPAAAYTPKKKKKGGGCG